MPDLPYDMMLLDLDFMEGFERLQTFFCQKNDMYLEIESRREDVGVQIFD